MSSDTRHRRAARYSFPPQVSAAVAVAQVSPRLKESTKASSPGPGGASAYSGRSVGKRVSSICSAAYL